MSVPVTTKIQPVILAGGAGQRLWPLSNSVRPKQFMSLGSEKSLIEETVERVSGDSYLRPVVICSEALGDAIADRVPHASLVLEPVARNSAAAIALAACLADPEAILLVLPSDHRIKDDAPFHDAIAKAAQCASRGRIVTFGVRPTYASTGYGYIRSGAPIAEGCFEASSFVEKPDEQTAGRLIGEGGTYWNAGIFLFRASDMIEELRSHAPDILKAAQQAVEEGEGKAGRILAGRQAFARSPSISIDYAVMEKSSRVAVVPVDMDWSDIGSWQSVYDFLAKDAEGNAVDGPGIAIDSRDCLLKSEGPRIVIIGLDGISVIANDGHVLVLPTSRAQDARMAADTVAKLNNQG